MKDGTKKVWYVTPPDERNRVLVGLRTSNNGGVWTTAEYSPLKKGAQFVHGGSHLGVIDTIEDATITSSAFTARIGNVAEIEREPVPATSEGETAKVVTAKINMDAEGKGTA